MSDATPQLTLVPDVLDGDREAAYLVYATQADGNAAETARILGIPERTVQHWARLDGWPARLDSERSRLAAVAVRSAQLALGQALHPVVAGLVRIAIGQGDTKTVLDKRGDPVTVELPVPYQARVNAANSLLDRFGFVAGMPAPADDRGDGDEDRPRTPQELQARSRQLLEARRQQRAGRPR